MNFALSDEQILLRDMAATFVDKETSLRDLLVPGATVAQSGYAANWEKIRELGWPGLVIPEPPGGVGLDCIELSVIVTELGRTLMPCPLAGHVFGSWALLKAGSADQQSELLGEAAAGARLLALVPPVDGNAVTADAAVRLNGEHPLVIDALAADTLIVAATRNGVCEWYLVDARQPGVAIELQPWRDITRQVCRVAFTNAAARRMPGGVTATWPWLRDRIACVLAAENVGGMRTVLNTTVAYANERMAFGRQIGAYQAIKHPLAEMLGALECSSAAVLYAAWALADGDDRAALAASMAKSYSSDAYVDATHRSIQIFGAIGFTWEMQNHLYFKRARANAAMFGQSRAHREHVINLASGRIWSDPFGPVAARAA